MEFAYSDIIGLRRPAHDGDAFSRRHPKMAQLNRAKIFAPFAALSGYDEAVRSKQVPYVPRRQRDAEEMRALNRALKALERATRTGALARRNRVVARVEYFEVCRDPNHEAFGRDGLYHALTGVVWRVDPVGRVLVIGERTLPFADIHGITLSTESTIAK
jgi:hypothetical protein